MIGIFWRPVESKPEARPPPRQRQDELLGPVHHFVYHDSRQAPLNSVSTVLEQKEKPLKSCGLADDRW
jgi:hypothetical protein